MTIVLTNKKLTLTESFCRHCSYAIEQWMWELVFGRVVSIIVPAGSVLVWDCGCVDGEPSAHLEAATTSTGRR